MQILAPRKQENVKFWGKFDLTDFENDIVWIGSRFWAIPYFCWKKKKKAPVMTLVFSSRYNADEAVAVLSSVSIQCSFIFDAMTWKTAIVLTESLCNANHISCENKAHIHKFGQY